MRGWPEGPIIAWTEVQGDHVDDYVWVRFGDADHRIRFPRSSVGTRLASGAWFNQLLPTRTSERHSWAFIAEGAWDGRTIADNVRSGGEVTALQMRLSMAQKSTTVAEV